jgi:ribosomal protein S18 acetylase RimI-like enzyme
MIYNMTDDKIQEYAQLFVKVFNHEPWNDKWSTQTAAKRIIEIMKMPTFEGMAWYEEEKLVGIIFGRSEQYFDGIFFQILEFCVDGSFQGKGIGTSLLEEFTNYLKMNQNIKQIYLLTMRDERTEGYYQRRGFITSDSMCFMSKGLE